jgi:methionyl-tRNA formyltransferase
MALRVVFMGTPDFSVATLQAIAAAGHAIVAAYTRPPRPAGRGMAEQRSPAHAAATALGIPVLIPQSLRDPAVQAEFAAHRADVGVVVAYGLILPKSILDAPRHGCLNVHASLLPRWRGAAPIQRAIMAGDRESGVSVMRMAEGLDTGPVCLAERVPIGPEETAGTLHDRLAALGAKLMVEALAQLERGALVCAQQPDAGATYAVKIDKAEARIDWNQPAAVLARRIQGLSPVPGAWCEFATGDRPERVKILGARLVTGSGAPGTVLTAEPVLVACGDGALELGEVQRAGRKAVPAAEFLRGARLQPGDRLA